MKDVHDRIVPYYTNHILPELRTGQNVLVVAHGNSLRALVMHLENMSHEKLGTLEFGTGEVYCYQTDAAGKIVGKEIRAANPDKLKV